MKERTINFCYLPSLLRQWLNSKKTNELEKRVREKTVRKLWCDLMMQKGMSLNTINQRITVALCWICLSRRTTWRTSSSQRRSQPLSMKETMRLRRCAPILIWPRLLPRLLRWILKLWILNAPITWIESLTPLTRTKSRLSRGTPALEKPLAQWIIRQSHPIAIAWRAAWRSDDKSRGSAWAVLVSLASEKTLCPTCETSSLLQSVLSIHMPTLTISG